MASSTTTDSLVTQEALRTWNYIYRQKAFKGNVQRGVYWQTVLQNYLLRHGFNKKEEEENHLQKEKEEKLKKADEKKKKGDQIKKGMIEVIQKSIKIKLEPNTTLTEITNKDDEDSIKTIRID
jgi:hypothetical protein